MKNDQERFGELFQDQERILMQAIPLPNDGALTDEQRTRAMENFKAFIIDHKIGPADVAESLGRPRGSTIRELMKGEYRDGSDKHIRTLNMWVEQRARQAASKLDDRFVADTQVAKDVLTTVRLVYENQTMGLICGPTGVGKSRCLQAAAERYPGSLYIRMLPAGYQTATGVVQMLAEALDVTNVNRFSGRAVKRRVLGRVIERLQDTKRLIIIDDADNVSLQALEALRAVHDVAGVPVLLSGTVDLHDRIQRTADPDHGQLYSRFEVVRHLSQGRDVFNGDRRGLFTMKDIRALYDQPPIRLADDAARHLLAIANHLGDGSLRRCRALVRNAARRARKRQGLPEGAKVTIQAEDLEFVDRLLRKETGERARSKERQRRMASRAG
jgi:hypothetical protein